MIAIALVHLRSRNWRFRSLFHDMSPETFWLLCWSIGGLVAMSLIPSKRVDRIFPVIPPLCLLLAAQIPARACRRYLCTVATLVLAIIFSGGYTGWKVIAGYRDHRDALAAFGRNVRHEVDAHHWRYDVVPARDEGLLLYLQKMHFSEPQRAMIEWNNGNVDALVASKEKATMMMPKLRGAVITDAEKAQTKEYVLITR
jgi:hypothetical protein